MNNRTEISSVSEPNEVSIDATDAPLIPLEPLFPPNWHVRSLYDNFKDAAMKYIQMGNGNDIKKDYKDFIDDGVSIGQKDTNDRANSSKMIVSNIENHFNKIYVVDEGDKGRERMLTAFLALVCSKRNGVSKQLIELLTYIQTHHTFPPDEKESNPTEKKKEFKEVNLQVEEKKKELEELNLEKEEVNLQVEEIKKELEELNLEKERSKKEGKSKRSTIKPTILENPLPGYPRRINVPHTLTKPITIQFIKENSNSLDDITKKILYPVMKHIVFPKTIKALRKPLIWRTISMRILNYFISLIILVKHAEDPRMPKNLIYPDGIPPWWFVCNFFRHFQFKIAKSENQTKNKTKEATTKPKKQPVQAISQSLELQTKLQQDYLAMHRYFFTSQYYCKNSEAPYQDLDAPKKEMPYYEKEDMQQNHVPSYEKEDTEQSTDKEEAEPMVEKNDSPSETFDNLDLEILDCHLDSESKRPIAFNNVCKFISWYNKRREYGAYDEFSPSMYSPKKDNTSDPDPNDPFYIAHHGLHHLEVQIMEVVLNANVNVRRTIFTNYIEE